MSQYSGIEKWATVNKNHFLVEELYLSWLFSNEKTEESCSCKMELYLTLHVWKFENLHTVGTVHLERLHFSPDLKLMENVLEQYE